SQASRKIRPTTSSRPSSSWPICPLTPAVDRGAAAFSASAASAASGSSAATAIRTRISAQLPDALALADHVSQANPELLVDHHHLSVGDQGAVDQHVERLAGQAIQLDHRALVELQQVADAD